MNWVALGSLVFKLVKTAVSLTENSQTSLKGKDKLALAMSNINNLAANCQEFTPQQMIVLSRPDVQAAMREQAEANVKLENVIAKAWSEVAK